MHEETIELLACPDCRGSLHLQKEVRGHGGTIEEGQLSCSSCAQGYPIREGIPLLLKEGQQGKVGRNFGYKWKAYPDFLSTYEGRFLDNIHPLTPDVFRGKTVLEACCGIGIPDFYIARAGARRVIGFDVSDSIFIARKRCREYPNVDFVKADIASLPFQPKFDIAVCLAALHHLPVPREGFDRLVSALRPGGTLMLWVYGREGSRPVRWFVDPVRSVLARRCPLPLLNGIAGACAVGLWGVVHGVYRPWARGLPMFEYMQYIRHCPFRQLHEMVFDQLLSPITHYLTQEELVRWFKEERFARYEVTPMNGMSWRAYGILPAN